MGLLLVSSADMAHVLMKHLAVSAEAISLRWF